MTIVTSTMPENSGKTTDEVEEMAEHIHMVFDQNGDGTVCPDEFSDFMDEL